MPILILVLLLAGCSSPTAPTPAPPVAVVPPPPVVVAPTPTPAPTPAPAPPFPPSDPRFNLTLYRQLVHNAYDLPLQPLRRHREAPRLYLRTIDDAGQPIDIGTLNDTANALDSVATMFTGSFGLAAIERGTDTRRGQPGWITVNWSQFPNEQRLCGQAQVAGDWITLYPRSQFCRCPGGPAVSLAVVKHELGHALGFWHTDNRDDLMFGTYNACNANPTDRERYHAALAYTRPIGSAAP